MNKKLFLGVFILIVLLSSITLVAARERVVRYEWPHKQNDFCGVHINYQYCKCGFHNEFCNAIGMERSQARQYVHDQYREHVKDQMQKFAEGCIATDGIWNRPSESCIRCDVGFQKDQARCVVNHASEDIAERYGLPMDVETIEPTHAKNRAQVYSSDGEVFVYSVHFQKWRGPVRSGQPIYEGDILITTGRGEATVRMWSDKGDEHILRVSPESRIDFPDTSPTPEESWPVWVKNGAVDIFNELYDAAEEKLDDGAKLTPSGFNTRLGPTVVVGSRGTEVLLTYDNKTDQGKVVLNEGLVDVFLIDSTKITPLRPGEQIFYQASTLNPITTFEMSDWEDILEEEQIQLTTISQEQLLAYPQLEREPIDNDAVYPEELAFGNDLVGELQEPKNNLWWLWLLIFLGVLAAGYYFYMNKMKN